MENLTPQSILFFTLMFMVTEIDKGQSAECMFSDSVQVDGICYRLNKTSLSWTDAKASCESWSGVLAMVLNSTQAAAALNYSTEVDYAYFGANDIKEEGNWTWDHNKQPLGKTVGLWGPDQPNNQPDLNCAIIKTAPPYEALANYCDRMQYFLCMEYAEITVTSVSTDFTSDSVTSNSTHSTSDTNVATATDKIQREESTDFTSDTVTSNSTHSTSDTKIATATDKIQREDSTTKSSAPHLMTSVSYFFVFCIFYVLRHSIYWRLI